MELSPKILELAPSNCSNVKEMPFLTVGSDIGERAYVYENLEAGIIVEDVKDEENNISR